MYVAPVDVPLVTTPALLTVAIEVLELLQVPPVVASASVVALPVQTESEPVIDAG